MSLKEVPKTEYDIVVKQLVWVNDELTICKAALMRERKDKESYQRISMIVSFCWLVFMIAVHFK